MSAGKVALIVIGIFSGSRVVRPPRRRCPGCLWAYGTQRDADGFFTTSTYDLATDEAAITTEDLGLRCRNPGSGGPRATWPRCGWRRTGFGAGVHRDRPPVDEVDTYLADVGRAELPSTSSRFDDTPDLAAVPGARSGAVTLR